MHAELLVGLVVLASICHIGFGCSCFPMTKEEEYCRADFVMKVKIRSHLKNPEGDQSFDAFYRVRRLYSPWKFDNEEFVKYPHRIYTGSNSALCGITGLSRGKSYLISGRVDKTNGKMRIDACTSIVVRSPLSSSIKSLRKNPPNCDVTTMIPSTSSSSSSSPFVTA